MKKTILASIMVIGLLVISGSGALAATETQQQEIDNIYQQMLDLRQLLIDKYVASNQITKEQGDFMKERNEIMHGYRYQLNNGAELQRGYGCGGYGRGMGMMGGMGMMRGMGMWY